MLEELGIKPKRVAGASAGAIVAALIAAGYTSEEMKDVLKMDLSRVMLGILRNLILINFYYTKLDTIVFVKKSN